MKQGDASRLAPDKVGSRVPGLSAVHAPGTWEGSGQRQRWRAVALTCRRSFHRATPLGTETADPWLAPPITGPSPATASVPPAPAAANSDSIPRAGWTRRCLRHNSAQSRPDNFFPVRTCDAWPLAHSPCVRPPRIPHFRYSRLHGNQDSGVTSLHQFSGSHL